MFFLSRLKGLNGALLKILLSSNQFHGLKISSNKEGSVAGLLTFGVDITDDSTRSKTYIKSII
jgi:hypothetical protein